MKISVVDFFIGPMKEQVKEKIVPLPEVTYFDMNLLLHAIYEPLGKAELTAEGHMRLYCIADRFTCNTVMVNAKNALSIYVDKENVAQIHEFAKKNNLARLSERCVDFIVANGALSREFVAELDTKHLLLLFMPSLNEMD